MPPHLPRESAAFPVSRRPARRRPPGSALLLGIAAAFLPLAAGVSGAVPAGEGPSIRLAPEARGASGAVRLVVADPGEVLSLPLEGAADLPADATYRWAPLDGGAPDGLAGAARLRHGLQAPLRPGLWRLELRVAKAVLPVEALKVAVSVPFEALSGGELNGYRMGGWPVEGTGLTDRYAPPARFLEVTPASRTARVSDQLRLGDFLTKDQADVWPKYVALDPHLLDKLELVWQELARMGVRAEGVHVMSGFRTPHYNGPGGNGRARLSRHMYGDAADVWFYGSDPALMADLNGDGRVDYADAMLVVRAAERVQQRHPHLSGGVGAYHAAPPYRGPFVHIDVRGEATRW